MQRKKPCPLYPESDIDCVFRHVRFGQKGMRPIGRDRRRRGWKSKIRRGRRLLALVDNISTAHAERGAAFLACAAAPLLAVSHPSRNDFCREAPEGVRFRLSATQVCNKTVRRSARWPTHRPFQMT